MEKLFYDLSEQEFSKGRKILLWIFSGIFLLAGCAILYMMLVLGDKSVNASLAIAPFGIGIFVAVIALMATFKRTGHYFLIDNEKIEYKYGLVKPIKYSHIWTDIKEVHLPHREKKVLLVYKDNSEYVINLNWLEKKKTSHIRKHFFYAAKEKNINIVKVMTLPRKSK
jgi:hypothetical protein